jgi:hypothetical protein
MRKPRTNPLTGLITELLKLATAAMALIAAALHLFS